MKKRKTPKAAKPAFKPIIPDITKPAVKPVILNKTTSRPVEVVKLDLSPHKFFHVQPPPDHVPVVAIHPDKLEFMAVPKEKKRTFWDWLIGS